MMPVDVVPSVSADCLVDRTLLSAASEIICMMLPWPAMRGFRTEFTGVKDRPTSKPRLESLSTCFLPLSGRGSRHYCAGRGSAAQAPASRG